MNTLFLHNVLPNVFSDKTGLVSDIWEKEVFFKRGCNYLIEAASGVGKSSLCSYLYGYRNDYSGEIQFDEQNLKIVSSESWDTIRSRHLSLLFQELRLFAELSVSENILLKNSLTDYKMPSQIELMLDQLGIADKRDVKVGKLSWGQRQRVAIIRSLCQPFDFLILDEPISHLDDKNASAAAQLIMEEARAQGASIIVTSIGKSLSLNYIQTLAL